jgi:hypothetical protein
MVTLGRHPGPWRGAESFVDAELVAFTGIVVTLVVIWSPGSTWRPDASTLRHPLM